MIRAGPATGPNWGENPSCFGAECVVERCQQIGCAAARPPWPEKKLPFPALIFDGQLKTRQAPGTSFAPYPIPVLAAPKRVLAAFERLRSIRTYPDAQRAHIGTKDALNNEVKIAFGQGNLSWKPGHLRSAYAAICCHKFKPQNMTPDIVMAEILGHKLLPGAAALSVGQSYKDFYIRS